MIGVKSKHSYDARAGFGLDYYDISEVEEATENNYVEKEKLKEAIEKLMLDINYGTSGIDGNELKKELGL